MVKGEWENIGQTSVTAEDNVGASQLFLTGKSGDFIGPHKEKYHSFMFFINIYPVPSVYKAAH